MWYFLYVSHFYVTYVSKNIISANSTDTNITPKQNQGVYMICPRQYVTKLKAPVIIIITHALTSWPVSACVWRLVIPTHTFFFTFFFIEIVVPPVSNCSWTACTQVGSRIGSWARSPRVLRLCSVVNVLVCWRPSPSLIEYLHSGSNLSLWQVMLKVC